MTDTIQKIQALAEPLALSLGLDLWGIEIVSGQRAVVRVYVETLRKNTDEAPGASAATPEPDRPEDQFPAEYFQEEEGQPEDDEARAGILRHGVTVDQCADLSRLLGLSLDVEDIVSGAYMLEVSSPGLERLFFTADQLAGAVGKVVEMTLSRPAEGFPNRRKFKGTLLELREGMVSLGLSGADTPDNTPATAVFPYEIVKKAKLVFMPPEKALPGKAAKAAPKKDRSGKKDSVKEGPAPKP
jgi:Uncharacterized protein conserved in bacteria